MMMMREMDLGARFELCFVVGGLGSSLRGLLARILGLDCWLSGGEGWCCRLIGEGVEGSVCLWY